MRRAHYLACVLGVVVTSGLIFFRQGAFAEKTRPAPAAAAPAALKLPIAQVVLFSSGVGMFQREGTVDGNVRVDLSFPVDIGDIVVTFLQQ